MNTDVSSTTATLNPFSATSETESTGDRSKSHDVDVFDKRKQRIRTHLLDSLGDEDTRTSIIGAVSADVMMLQLQVSDALQGVLGTGRCGPDLLSRNREGIDMFLKLSKLVTQISQLHRKMLADTETTDHDQESEEMKS
jgi:hypothetical protein